MVRDKFALTFEFQGRKFMYTVEAEKVTHGGQSKVRVVFSIDEPPERMVKIMYAVSNNGDWTFEHPPLDKILEDNVDDPDLINFHVLDETTFEDIFTIVLMEQYFIIALKAMMDKEYKEFGNNVGGMRFKMPSELSLLCLQKASQETDRFFSKLREMLGLMEV